jgi:RNA polymerase sigma-70 factor (ECF subfamily)
VTEDEFKEFFTVMHPKLLRYAMRKLDVDSANEAAIDALRTIWAKGIAAPRDEDQKRQLQSLSYKITNGLISNRLRADRRHARLLDALITQQRTSLALAADVWGDASEGGFATALAQLSAADRGILSLLLDGYGVAEIATILGCRPGAASMRLKRARQRLKAQFERGQANG